MIDLSNKTKVYISSVTKLQRSQVLELNKLLVKKLNKPVEIIEKLDPTLLGGFYLQVADRVIDRSLKKQLHDLKVVLEGKERK